MEDLAKQRMLSGKWYKAIDPALRKEQLRIYRLLREYQEKFDQPEHRQEILQQILGQCDSTTFIQPPFHCDFGYNIKVGRNFFSNAFNTILDCAPVIIGDNVWLGPQVHIYAVTHPLAAKSRSQYWIQAKPVTINDHVWVGGNSVIMPGVTIGEGAVVGAGSVVTKDVPPFTLALGNPARVVKTLPVDSDEVEE
ncbi:hypothetical protein IWQ62_003569 [Dispira parvispora]|uniref:Maltose/galactoside acetyltransferase domain-containing protein n=1 Tax=Dispira parvispora TaxID=1520584 RepID=A0A9W8ATV6_9FUNG|nr:hypothetical protein IWQ62_003569 [Dispira parvispora]